MKRRKIYIVIAIILIIIAGLYTIYFLSKNTTNRETALDHINVKEISSIEIIKSGDTKEDQVTITDPSEIEKVMNSFSLIKLREVTVSSIYFQESYWITVKTNNQRRLGITLYDKSYMNVYDYHAEVQKNEIKSYKITNEFDPSSIRSLFEN